MVGAVGEYESLQIPYGGRAVGDGEVGREGQHEGSVHEGDGGHGGLLSTSRTGPRPRGACALRRRKDREGRTSGTCAVGGAAIGVATT